MYPEVLQTVSLGYLHPISSVFFPQIHTRNELIVFPVLPEQSRSCLDGNTIALEKVILWVVPCFRLSTLCSHQFLETPLHVFLSIFICFCEFLWNFLFVCYTIYFNSLYPIRKRVVQTANQLLNQWNKRSHKNQMASIDRMWDKFSLRQIFSL